MKQHAEAAIHDGKLFVKCPEQGCDRAALTIDLRPVLLSSDFELLCRRLAEAEAEADRGGGQGGALDLPDGMEVKLCPKCATKIEKSEGCDQMACWRCGEMFSWSKALSISPEKGAAPPSHPNRRAPLFGGGSGIVFD